MRLMLQIMHVMRDDVKYIPTWQLSILHRDFDFFSASEVLANIGGKDTAPPKY